MKTKQEEATPFGEQPKFTPGPWVVWRLAPDSDARERMIVTTADGEIEVCGIVENEDDAYLIAAAPEMYALLKAAQAYIETQDNETMPDEMAALWNRIAAALALVDAPQETK